MAFVRGSISWLAAAGVCLGAYGGLAQFFTKVQSEVFETETGIFHSAAWADFDNDGDLDLVAGNVYHVPESTNHNVYFRNDGGVLARATNSVVGLDFGNCLAVTVGDPDNDGDLDLFITNFELNNYFYRNNGDGTFVKVTEGLLVNDGRTSHNAAWGDYDNDGRLDLFLSRHGTNTLYRNLGDGAFARVADPALLADGFEAAQATHCAWADYNNDGFLDLFVARFYWQTNLLYHNNRDGTFTKIADGEIARDKGNSESVAWGDYNNDGYLDLFVSNLSSQDGNFLYRNNRDGTFARVTEGEIATDRASSHSAAWGDFDNDGHLDLYVANIGSKSFLYHNQGDGSFRKILDEIPVTDVGESLSAQWGDYDNDGDLDLFVGKGAFYVSQTNALYRNNGTANHWLGVRCVGTASNRAGLGAKVRLNATIAGTNFWQLREITAGDGVANASLTAHFGLGDARRADMVRIEWPSGIVQEFRDVSADQLLTVIEASPLRGQLGSDGAFWLSLPAVPGRTYQIQAATNLVDWVTLATQTGQPGQTLTFSEADISRFPQRFYRVLVSP